MATCNGRRAYGATDPNGCGDRATHPAHTFVHRGHLSSGCTDDRHRDADGRWSPVLSPFVRRAMAGQLPAKETVR
jgi:hypothetical protein